MKLCVLKRMAKDVLAFSINAALILPALYFVGRLVNSTLDNSPNVPALVLVLLGLATTFAIAISVAGTIDIAWTWYRDREHDCELEYSINDAKVKKGKK